MSDKSVFFDPTGRRASWLTRIGWITAVIVTVAAIGFGASLAVTHAPQVVGLTGPMSALFRPAVEGRATEPSLMQSAQRLADKLHEREASMARRANIVRTHNGVVTPSALSVPTDRGLAIGFYVNWDDGSFASLKQALPHLDWVVPSWLTLSGPTMAMTTDIDTKVLDLIGAEKPATPILPMIQNAVDGKWDGQGLAKLLANPTERTQRVADIVQFLDTNKFQGLTIDFEEVPSKAHPNLQAFLTELRDAFRPHNWVLTLAAPFDDSDWDYKAYADIVDYLVLMAYDQHWEEGTAGPIAAQSWFETTLDKRMAVLDPDHTIVAIGNYAYDWTKGKPAVDMTFQEAILAAQDSEADIDFDSNAENPHFTYTEDDHVKHDVWFLDAVTAYNEIHAADLYQPAGYALWRLGSEDPSIWSVMGRPYGAPAPVGLKTISQGGAIDFEGTGEILRVAQRPAAGTREFDVDPDTGDINDQTYTQLPTSYVIQRVGDQPKKLALTFDDGPDPQWTPQVLDILKAKGVPATFFVIGQNAAANPELLQRIVADGFDLGNHSYTHPNIGLIPAGLAKLEINATQRLVEAVTGRSMRLFRPPYFGDAEPTTPDEIVPIDIAQSMGYLTVGLRIDPDDWQRPPADTIVQRVLDQVASADPDVRGNIVLLHDSGGERSHTIEALPTLIDKLRAEGYEFVTVASLAGLTRDEAMPPLPAGAMARYIDIPVFATLGLSGALMSSLFVISIWTGLARLVFMCGLGLLNQRQDKRRKVPEIAEPAPLLSVLIPAHNEAKVIVASIARIVASDYPNLEIIVVDDGSTDGTSDVVRAAFDTNEKVRLLTIPNGGKAQALNHGIAHVQGEIIVALDADTQFEIDTISKLARWFADPKVGAVAGNAKVGNRRNMVTYWQALEYVTAQNLERRALAALGCITVVPGAVGAWRRSVLDDLGGFPIDTLAEDQDLTLSVQKAGYKVLFDSTAVAWTEAPDTLRGLARQRFRWSYGTLQCLWKHSDMLLRPRYGALGMVAMPQVWLFQIFLALLSPLVDLMFVLQLVQAGLDYLQHGSQFDPSKLITVSTYFALFLLVDAAAAVLALCMERGEKWSLMWWLLLQRFGYRQLMYYVVVKSVLKAGAGAIVGWGKLERKATVTAGK
jgi:cellulose synthase/poly-beta-1,6-N-acetylglucosamine synthase-like glycosyltransferase/peptidoglycan/xylan/chitin deacetylase (PgdA/CDA1 family)/spore germination protein YaaH